MDWFVEEIFGVPLDPAAEGSPFALEGLDETVRCHGQGGEARGELADRLMVPRVHHERSMGTEEASEVTAFTGPGRSEYRMSRMARRKTARAVEVVGNAARALLREILPKGSTERDVDHLRSTADSEYGGTEALASLEQSEVLCIASRRSGQTREARASAISGRSDVCTACENERVEGLRKRITGMHDRRGRAREPESTA